MITGCEIHTIIDSCRILPQGLFNYAHFVDKFLPIHGAQEAEAPDAVANGNLISRLLLILRLNQLANGQVGR